MYQLINLYEKSPQAKKLNLMFMNIRDVTLIANMLYRFKNLQEISFHGNKITTLPSLELIKCLTLLDVSNNPIKIDSYVLDGLYQSKSLKHLFIDCNSQQKQLIIQGLPNLQTLNGQNVYRQQIRKNTVEQQLAKLQKKLSDQMKRTKQIYNKMMETCTEKIQQIRQTKNYQQQFDLLENEIKEEMRYFYSGLRDKLSSQGVFAYCKNKLTIVFDNLIIRLLDQLGNQAMVKIFEESAKIKAENFDFLLKMIFNNSYEKYMDEQFQQPNNRLRKETLYQNQIFRLKKEIISLQQEKNKEIHVGQKYEILEDKKKQRQILKSLGKPLNKLIKINIMAPRINQHQDMKMSSNGRSPKERGLDKSPSARNMSKSPSNANMKRSLSSKNIAKTNYGQIYKHKPQRSSSKNINTNRSANKILNLDQLLKLIEETMVEKRKDNMKNLAKNEIFETAQEFMFTFFTRRYGLKEVALEWSLAMIKAIELYCKESIQVEIFGKILKNNLYEQYYDEVKAFTKDIDRILSSMNNKQSISQQPFKKIFFYFFSYENEEKFQSIVKTLTFPMNTLEIHYFLQSYKLTFQQKCLENFNYLFQKLDSNDDSCLSLKQSKELALNLLKPNKQLEDQQKNKIIQSLYSTLDKLKKDKLIFSQVFQIIHKWL